MARRGRPRKTPINPVVPAQTQQTSIPTEAFLYFLIPDGKSINADSVNSVKNAIRSATLKKLNFVVQSGGGDLYSAVKVIRILRTKFTNIIGVVPTKAMSAATLMLLGTDEIYMSEESQLGPLDLLMEHPVDGSIISAVDVVDTLNHLSSTTMNNAVEMYEKMRDLPNGEIIGKNHAMKFALESTIEIIKEISAQIDPYHRQKALRKLKIAQWYAYDLLRTGMMKTGANPMRTAITFVYSFPDHNYAIFKEDARDMLQLIIKDSTSYPFWNDVCTETENLLRGAKKPIINYIEK
ncbi:MAG: hypothetical protein HYW63_03500 [Candidatus Levybacteria bacterium]|nr:hypothetical protein [Candidatus Levybacteria bacterium]